jgi:ABC-type branched-subunit amino acid transport system permease subunit
MKARTLILAAGVALLLALPPLASALGQPYYIDLLRRVMILGIAAASLNLILGYGGLVSFGHAAYLGVGGYAVGIFAFHGVHNGWLQMAVALGLWVMVARTRLGMLIRAGASNRTMVAALGVNIRLLYTVVFGFGAALAGLAGLLAGPIYNVQPAMGELILIQVFVVIVIGGIGSIRGALFGSIIVGIVDTMGRAFLKPVLGQLISPPAAESAGPALASMMIYLLMAVVLALRPEGLFPVKSG